MFTSLHLLLSLDTGRDKFYSKRDPVSVDVSEVLCSRVIQLGMVPSGGSRPPLYPTHITTHRQRPRLAFFGERATRWHREHHIYLHLFSRCFSTNARCGKEYDHIFIISGACVGCNSIAIFITFHFFGCCLLYVRDCICFHF